MISLMRDDLEHPIPPALRPIFERIAKAFAEGDFTLTSNQIRGVEPIGQSTAEYIEKCVNAYGDRLVDLNPATWERSCYSFEGDYWVALVDLTTASEAVSDLTLHARIELSSHLKIWVESVHTP